MITSSFLEHVQRFVTTIPNLHGHLAGTGVGPGVLDDPLAGVGGDESARIFCQKLDAELVSIAGAYRVREDIDESLIGQPVQIYLQGEDLIIDPLSDPTTPTRRR